MYSYDSRSIKPGQLFLCLPGAERYCQEALEKGAKSIIKCSRKEMANRCHEALENPSKTLCVIGVTGTNGKTSVCSFVHEALVKLGVKSTCQGTLSTTLTTPESLDTITAMKAHLDSGGTHFVMEVSSHGIAQERIHGIDFDIKCLTNITQDHLDYHKTEDNYKAVKHAFMTQYPGQAIYPEAFNQEAPIENSGITGQFNQKNLKAAYCILRASGIDKKQAREALTNVSAPPGRFEAILSQAPFTVIVDYAHTPDGLKNILEEARKMTQGKLITCFGCGGDRDRSKRPLMAEQVSHYSDFFVITNDNPRTENPQNIIDDIVKGVTHNAYKIETDRKKAIDLCLATANKNDTVIIAGKGHETGQVIGNTRHEFNDKTVAKECLKERGFL